MASNSRIERMRADSLKVHPLAQRELIPARLKKLAANLDLDAIGILHAVEYEIAGHGKGVWIVDGQHRLMAIMEHGFGEWMLEVKIHLDATDDARASQLFLKLNDRASVSPYDKFKNAIRAGETAAQTIQDLAERRGMAVSKQCGEGKLTCVSSLYSVYALDGGRTLGRTLDVITGAWGKRSAALNGKVIDGIARVVVRYNGSMDRDAFINKLAKYPGGPAALVGDAKGRLQFQQSSLASCIALIAIEVYNSGRRYGKLEIEQ